MSVMVSVIVCSEFEALRAQGSDSLPELAPWLLDVPEPSLGGNLGFCSSYLPWVSATAPSATL